MREHGTIKSNSRILQVAVTLGAAVVILATTLWISASKTPSEASSPHPQQTTALSNSSTITIGVAAGLSGGISDIGWRQANAVQLAISQTNAAGGITVGNTVYTLTLVTVDSACDATQAVTAANTLLDANAVAIVGHTCSNASFSAQPIYNAANVPMVSASSSSMGLTEQGYTTTFRVFPKDDAPADLLATHFRQWLSFDRVAIIKLSGSWWADDLAETFSTTFTSLGGAITSENIVASTDDYTATLTTIQSENPDAIYYTDDNAQNAGLLSKIAYEQGMDNVIIGWDTFWTFDTSDYATVAGVAAEGDLAGINERRPENMPGYDDLNAAYQAAGFPNEGDEAQSWGAFAYDAVKIIIDAIDRADSTAPPAIRDAIANTTSYEGVVGLYEGFDDKGDAIPQWAHLERYENGQWVVLNPTQVFLPLVFNDFQ